MDRLALILAIIGAVIWGVVGIFGLNPLLWITGAMGAAMGIITRIAYILIALGGIWCIKLLFHERESVKRTD